MQGPRGSCAAARPQWLPRLTAGPQLHKSRCKAPVGQVSHCKAPATKDSLPRATPSLSCRELLPELLCRELLLVCCAENYSRAVVPRATRELLCRELLRVYRADACVMLRNKVSCRTCGFRDGFRFHSNRESFKLSSAAGRRPALAGL